MAEVKNAFIKSKMNKDLDARVLPPGEYRNAINAQVSKSEGSDVGALENALGNDEIANFSTITGVSGLKSIGFLTDDYNNNIYILLTDNTPISNPSGVYKATGVGSNHFIYVYNALNNTSIKLIQGAFLNFSTLNPVTGINILEGLLFWTDNRNQPRRLNASTASSTPGYYTSEDQISVATYNPFQPIDLYQASVLSPGDYETTMKDVVSEYYPNGGAANTTQVVSNTNAFTINSIIGIIEPSNGAIPGAPVSYISGNNVVSTGQTVVSYAPGSSILTLSGPVTLGLGVRVLFYANPYLENDYKGDDDYLQDKFVRFSYRFRFEDNDYSIFAPFTQPAFIPKQDGYFLNYTDQGQTNSQDDQKNTYRTTVVEFMENKVNKINLAIPLPFPKTEIIQKLKLSSIDILFKESNGLIVKVVDTILADTVATQSAAGDANTFIYEYKSQKAYKTLPESELIRVYDKVPVKALSQEIISNRVVYANYQDKHTPPDFIDYNVSSGTKSAFSLSSGSANVNQADVNNVSSFNIDNVLGAILIGSSVTGAGVTANTTVVSFASPLLTLSSSQTLANDVALTFAAPDTILNTTSFIEYPNHTLKQNRNYQVGIVLSDRFGRQSTTILSKNPTTLFAPYYGENIDPTVWPGDSLKILFNNVITAPPAPAIGWPGLYNGDTTSSTYNPLGWYSYKVVVKQTEQEYYNVYLPGVMKGYPRNNSQPEQEIGRTSHAVLINDNINKVPRDLVEVGPTQKQFRSSVELFGRVENISPLGRQFYPQGTKTIVSTIATNDALFNGQGLPPGTGADKYEPSIGFYNIDSNPLIARISTNRAFGVSDAVSGGGGGNVNIYDCLAIYETAPVESLLDIFWETSTSGLISELNNAIENEAGGSADILGWNTSLFLESIGIDGTITNPFSLVDNFGTPIVSPNIGSLTLNSVFNLANNDISSSFELVAAANDTFTIKVLSGFVYDFNAAVLQNYEFTFTAVVTIGGSTITVPNIKRQGALGNVSPSFGDLDGLRGCAGDRISVQAEATSIIARSGKNGANGIANPPFATPATPSVYDSLTMTVKRAFRESTNVDVAAGVFTVPETSGSLAGTDPFTVTVTKQQSFQAPAGNYTIVLELEDAGGAKVECNVLIALEDQTCRIYAATHQEDSGIVYTFTECSGGQGTVSWDDPDQPQQLRQEWCARINTVTPSGATDTGAVCT